MTETTPPKGPVLIDLTDTPEPAAETPASAPPVEDRAAESAPTMATLAQIAARPGSPYWGWFLGLGGALVSALLALAAFATLEALMARSAILGGALSLLMVAFVGLCVVIVLRELAGLARLSRLDKIHRTAGEVLDRADLEAARKLSLRLSEFYANRKDLQWSSDGLDKAVKDHFDADAVLGVAERALMEPLDARALKEVEAAARQVATVTALVPLALADLLVALVANLRMIRRVAEIYGGRAGTLGSWRLTRAVLSHLVATGALAVSDDMIGSVLGGGVMSQVSRRFGEGVVNGALTARVGVAAIEVCRPLPYMTLEKPAVGGVVKRALAGVFQKGMAG